MIEILAGLIVFLIGMLFCAPLITGIFLACEFSTVKNIIGWILISAYAIGACWIVGNAALK